MKKFIAITGLTVAAGLMPFVSFAAINEVCDIVKLANTIARWFGIVVFAIAVISILYAALLFLTGGGNEETQSKAKQVLVYGLIGIAVALLATNATGIIEKTIGGRDFSKTNCVNIPVTVP